MTKKCGPIKMNILFFHWLPRLIFIRLYKDEKPSKIITQLHKIHHLKNVIFYSYFIYPGNTAVVPG